jgi:predicted ArsR family transcriptional regulator
VTVARLAEALSLSQQAVRRHLDGLRADGLVDVRLDRHGVGRPTLIFFATPLGEEVGGRTYVQLLSRLVRHFENADKIGEATSGHQLLDNVFAGIAAEVAADHEAEVKGKTVAERVAEASQALQREGIVDGWRREDDGAFQMRNGECPYLRLAEMSEAPCRADRQSIELLVGEPVEQTQRIADGAPACEYIIRPAESQEVVSKR